MSRLKGIIKKVRLGDWISLGLIALFIVCLIIFSRIAGTLPTLDAADAFRGGSDMGFAQIGCYLTEADALEEAAIYTFRSTLNTQMTEASIVAPEDGSLYRDAYSAIGDISVSTDFGSATVKTIGVGGDFFLFHPLYLRSGSYISDDDFMQDRVVLDEELAWKLFGSFDVTGMSVNINGVPYQVAGVVKREKDFATTAAYVDGAGMFMCYDAFYSVTQEKITSYEIVLPNLVSGFGLKIVQDNFPIGTGDIVENSSRYSIGSLIKVVGNFGKRSMRENGVIYPYWENAVRLTEDYLALLMVIMGLLLIYPVVRYIVIIVKFIVRNVKKAEKKIPEALEKHIEEHREREYEKEKVER